MEEMIRLIIEHARLTLPNRISTLTLDRRTYLGLLHFLDKKYKQEFKELMFYEGLKVVVLDLSENEIVIKVE